MASASKKTVVVWLEISEPSSKLCHDHELFFLRYFHAHIVTIHHRRRPTRFRATTLHCIQLRLKLPVLTWKRGESRVDFNWLNATRERIMLPHGNKIFHSQKKQAIDFVWASMAKATMLSFAFRSTPPTHICLSSKHSTMALDAHVRQFSIETTSDHIARNLSTRDLQLFHQTIPAFTLDIIASYVSYLSYFCHVFVLALTGSRLVGTELNTNTRRSCLAQQIECRPMQIREKTCWIRSRFVGGSVESQT